MKTNDFDARLVYTTGLGSICPDCRKSKHSCVCRKIKKAAVPDGAGIVRVRYETSGRKGKPVTLISGLPLSENALLELARKLKQQFGTGGSVKDFCIELQGDQRGKARETLRKLGYSL